MSARKRSSPRSALKRNESPRSATSPSNKYMMADGETSSSDSAFGGSPSSQRQKLAQTQQQAATQSLMNKSRDMIRKLTEDLSAERLHSQQLQSELDDASNQLSEHRSVSSDMRREIDLLQEKEDHYRSEIEHLHVNEESLSAHVAELDTLLSQRESELSVAQEYQARYEQLEGSLHEHKQAHGSLQESHSAVSAEHANHLEKYQEQTAELSTLRLQLAESQAQALAKTEAMKTADSERAELRGRLEVCLGDESQKTATLTQLEKENERLNALVKYIFICSLLHVPSLLGMC
jgi:chromosome segregation ATPase